MRGCALTTTYCTSCSNVLLAEAWNFCHDVEIAKTVQGLGAKGEGVRTGKAEAQEVQDQKPENVSADLQLPLFNVAPEVHSGTDLGYSIMHFSTALLALATSLVAACSGTVYG
ncbi:hypothetical protein PISL3812_07941 [Talaromyces islandicus]|uniref:Uncharacterized protein n=1 Tax=Talaromyces islandicus TaxID=28573 RepID=A0A0U1M5T6_TALIS|nr:hypothetical protein PISL3812_07941 [Talaromyces islandicus]